MSGRAKNKSCDSTPANDNEYLDECIKLNGLCAAQNCKKSVKVINIRCNLCSSLFCTTHALPEVHGCGNAAKKAASKPQKKPVSEERTAKLENNLSKKIDKMKNDRKKKQNKT